MASVNSVVLLLTPNSMIQEVTLLNRRPLTPMHKQMYVNPNHMWHNLRLLLQTGEMVGKEGTWCRWVPGHCRLSTFHQLDIHIV